MYDLNHLTDHQKMVAGGVAAITIVVVLLIVVVLMHKKPAAATKCTTTAECAKADPALPYCVGGMCAAQCVAGSTTAACSNDAAQCVDQKCVACTNVAGGGTTTGCPSAAPFCFTTGGFPAGNGTCVECGYNSSSGTSYGCAADQVCAPANLQAGPGACAQCFLDKPGSATNPGIGCANSAVYTPGAGASGACLAAAGLAGTGPGQCHDCVVWSAGVSSGCTGDNVCTSSSGATGPGTCAAPAPAGVKHADKKIQLNSQFGSR
jgi:hypothetical protein